MSLFSKTLLVLALITGWTVASGNRAFSHEGHEDGPGPGPGTTGSVDSGRSGSEGSERAMRFHNQLADRLNFLTSRLEAGKNPRALEIADRIRTLLNTARAELSEGRISNAFHLLGQAESLCAELGRLSSDSRDIGRRSGPGTQPDLYRDSRRPSSSQKALADAYALHKRLQDHLLRLKDRPGQASTTDRARSLQARIQDLLDKCKESLTAGKAEAARELALKAETLLAELHLAVAGSPGSGDPGLRRLEERVQRGTDLVRRRLSDGGAAERLSTASALLDQARIALSGGNAEAAENLLKQAEKILGETGKAAEGRLSAGAFDRLQSKLDKAGSIVKASGSEKAARILEKGMEHFSKAQRFRSEGQAVRAEVEMDISLKLAVKAVDIARASSR